MLPYAKAKSSSTSSSNNNNNHKSSNGITGPQLVLKPDLSKTSSSTPITASSIPKTSRWNSSSSNATDGNTKTSSSVNDNFHSLSQHSRQSHLNKDAAHTSANQQQGSSQFSHQQSNFTNQPTNNQAAKKQQADSSVSSTGRIPIRKQQSAAVKDDMNNESSTIATSPSEQKSFNRIGYSKPRELNRETNELVAMIREELEEDNEQQQQEEDEQQQQIDANQVEKNLYEQSVTNTKDTDLNSLASLERNLPVELSFLIRQQAYCMARINNLNRQIQEMKDSRRQQQHQQQQQQQQVNQLYQQQLNHIPTLTAKHHNHIVGGRQDHHHHIQNNYNYIKSSNNKNGNFILSDDSGGEYSRVTMSDDDELSSLLDQIAKKTIQPSEFNSLKVSSSNNSGNNNNNSNQRNAINSMNHHTMNYHLQQQPRQYAIFNPNLMQPHHQQPVPVMSFLMSPQFAMAHPSSINSTVLPGVHFQPEARYNQYYEDLYVRNNPPASTTQGGGGVGYDNNSPTAKFHQFDSTISAIEQLVNRKEKRQIKSQLRSADNWLKMRSSGGDFDARNFTNVAGNGGDDEGDEEEEELGHVRTNLSSTGNGNRQDLDGNTDGADKIGFP